MDNEIHIKHKRFYIFTLEGEFVRLFDDDSIIMCQSLEYAHLFASSDDVLDCIDTLKDQISNGKGLTDTKSFIIGAVEVLVDPYYVMDVVNVD